MTICAPCFSSLRVAELVWSEGTLIKDYPPESYEIKCMDDTWEYLKTENAVPKFESYIRGWMKQIQELLLESEQLRLETDDAGPQVSGDLFLHFAPCLYSFLFMAL